MHGQQWTRVGSLLARDLDGRFPCMQIESFDTLQCLDGRLRREVSPVLAEAEELIAAALELPEERAPTAEQASAASEGPAVCTAVRKLRVGDFPFQ